MSRKILFIIAGAILFLVLLILLWLWFLNRPTAEPSNPSGFATSTDRNFGTGNDNQGGNQGNVVGQSDYTITQTPQGYLVQGAGNAPLSAGTYRVAQGGRVVGTYSVTPDNLGQYTFTPQGITAGGLTSGSYTLTPIRPSGGLGGIGSGGISVGSPIQIPTGSSTPDITPIASTTGTTTEEGGIPSDAWVGSSASERSFNPSEIADINNPGTLGGTPLISRTPQPASLETSGIVIAATAAACIAQWVTNQAASLISSGASVADPLTATAIATNVPVLDLRAIAQRNSQSVIQCIVKSIAQAAIDQITRSVVGWINSGFNGKPSFVTNFNQYFANVADQAAGEFLKSSALSFLCSPFSAQIKIAIAQSYANRNNSGNSCTLSKAVGNINSFMNGKWGSGGWGGFLQFTTVPTNNPYGAYAQAQLGLRGAISNAQGNANRNVSAGGFIAVQKCDTSKGQSMGKGNCTVATPGQVIQDSLNQSLGSSINQLQVAQNINEIIRALINQLILKTLYGGLANANNGVTNPLAPAVDQAASAQAQTLLAGLQTSATLAVQYGAVKQGSAADVQQIQHNYNTLYNCWMTAASSTALSTEQRTQASQSAAQADAQITQLETQVAAYNNDVARANASLAVIQNLQSQVLFASTPEDVASASYAIQAAQAQLISPADVTTAQQDRTNLQTQLTATNQQVTASYNQCKVLTGS